MSQEAISHDLPQAAAVVVAAGRGERFGAMGKVLLPLGGRPILAHVLDAIEAAEEIGSVVVVVGTHTEAAVRELLQAGTWSKIGAVVLGGARRQDSVAAGVRATPPSADVVVIHDGARPMASPDLFDATVHASRRTGAAIAAVPVSDTLKRVGPDNQIVETVPREDMWAAQTPQAFRRDALMAAYETPTATDQTFTDEAALFEALGLRIDVVAGNGRNIKVTRPEDLAIAEALLQTRHTT